MNGKERSSCATPSGGSRTSAGRCSPNTSSFVRWTREADRIGVDPALPRRALSPRIVGKCHSDEPLHRPFQSCRCKAISGESRLLVFRDRVLGSEGWSIIDCRLGHTISEMVVVGEAADEFYKPIFRQRRHDDLFDEFLQIDLSV